MYNVLENKEEYIKNILEIDKAFYPEKYLWSVEEQLALYHANPDSLIIVGYNDEPIGYINYLCLTKEKYDEMKYSNVSIDDFKTSDILLYKPGNNYITVNSIAIKKEHQNRDVVGLINDTFLEKLKNYEKNGIHIAGMNDVAITPDGRKYSHNIGFTEVRKLDDGDYYLFICEDNPVEVIENSLNLYKEKRKEKEIEEKRY